MREEASGCLCHVQITAGIGAGMPDVLSNAMAITNNRAGPSNLKTNRKFTRKASRPQKSKQGQRKDEEKKLVALEAAVQDFVSVLLSFCTLNAF